MTVTVYTEHTDNTRSRYEGTAAFRGTGYLILFREDYENLLWERGRIGEVKFDTAEQMSANAALQHAGAHGADVLDSPIGPVGLLLS